MVQQVVADDPVELRVRMMGRNTLVETIAIISVIFLRLFLAVKLCFAARHSSAISDGGPMVPVETLAHAEIRRESVIHTKKDGSSVQDPSLVAGLVTRDVEGNPGPVWVDHESRDLCSHSTRS